MSSATKATLSVDGPLATITIATEGGLNVMSTDAVGQLGEIVGQVAENRDIRFAVIRAEGKVFIAGADIKEMADFDVDVAGGFGELGSSVCDAIEELPCITIAAIHGAALGGGCEIVLATDFRIATENVKIGLPETTLGLIPGWGGVPRACLLAGVTAAKKLIYGGVPVSATEAKSMGLIDEVVADAGALDEAVKALFASLAKGSPAAIALAKQAMYEGDDVAAFAECFAGPESREGMAAFTEKRPAEWMKG